jgi:hypothetical protein
VLEPERDRERERIRNQPELAHEAARSCGHDMTWTNSNQKACGGKSGLLAGFPWRILSHQPIHLPAYSGVAGRRARTNQLATKPEIPGPS